MLCVCLLVLLCLLSKHTFENVLDLFVLRFSCLFSPEERHSSVGNSSNNCHLKSNNTNKKQKLGWTQRRLTSNKSPVSFVFVFFNNSSVLRYAGALAYVPNGFCSVLLLPVVSKGKLSHDNKHKYTNEIRTKADCFTEKDQINRGQSFFVFECMKV